MKTTKPAPVSKSHGYFVPLLFVAILAMLFWKSFLPDYIHFANDGPLGQQNTAAIRLPGAFFGIWGDLNSFGNNGGLLALSLSSLLRWVLGPLGYAKFLAPIALFFLGISAWFFFRQLKFTPLAAICGGLAAMLVSTSFSDACWGVASHEFALGMDFCALGLMAGNATETSALRKWIRLILAGLAVGINVVEAADIGAILSVFVALFVFFKSLTEEGSGLVANAARGIGRVIVIAAFAGFIAAQAISSLIGTSIVGVVGTGQTSEAKAAQWDGATEWSLPKKESLGLIIPGLFGYRMDTPKGMMDFLQNDYRGGNYWGGIGRTPALDRYFDSGSKGPPPPGLMRFSGTAHYVGILVALIVAWTIAQSFRRENSVFTLPQRKFIWLGLAVLIFALLMSWGRFSFAGGWPYSWFYALPYASTIRNPAKFLIVFSFVTVILFGYGVHGLSKLYLQPAGNSAASVIGQIKNWWKRAENFDRKWAFISVAALVIAIAGWLIFISERARFIAYLGTVGFPKKEIADQIASFSYGQVGWFILFFALAVALVICIIAGVFSGKRARLGGYMLVGLLIVEMARANLPWIVFWNYKQKYEIAPAYQLNPVVDFLRQKPYEHRVATLPFPAPEQLQLFGDIYGLEWTQHLFPYYNIQSLDKVQQPREPVDQEAYERTLMPHRSDQIQRFIRYWQLTNTRYLLGPAGFLDPLNQLDSSRGRFRIVQRFNIVPKPGVDEDRLQKEFSQGIFYGEWLTAVAEDNGPYALFDFTGALPRAKLYTSWETNRPADFKNFSTNDLDDNEMYVLGEAGTNGFLTLQKLVSPSFDPERTVLLNAPLPEANPSAATNENAGTVEFKSYAPTKIIFAANAAAPSVLLLNDKYDPHWRVFVDGREAQLLEPNFIMQGVFLPAGVHTVEFDLSLPHRTLFITLAAFVLGIFLLVLLIFLNRTSKLTEK